MTGTDIIPVVVGACVGIVISLLWTINSKLRDIYWELKKLNETNVAKKAIGYDR